MISSVMTFARLSNSLEVCAMKSLGVSFLRILQPLLKFMVIIGIFISLCSHYLAPMSLKNTYNILNNLRDINPAVMLKPGIFNNDLPGVSIFVKKKTKNQQLENVIIYNHPDRNNNDLSGETLLTANNATLDVLEDGQKLNIKLKKGTDYITNKNTNSVTKVDFDKQNILIDMGNMNMNNSNIIQLQSTREILKLIDKQKDNINNNATQIVNLLEQHHPNIFANTKDRKKFKRKLMNDIITDKITKNLEDYASIIKKQHYKQLYNIRSSMDKIRFYKNIILRRVVELLVCIFFLVLGVSIGVLLKRGSFIIHLIMAFFFITLYYVMYIIGANIIFPYYATATIDSLFGLISLTPFTLFFCYHAAHDSQILNEGVGRLKNKIIDLTKKLLRRFKKKKEENIK